MKTKHYFSFVFASLFLIPSVITAQDVNYQKEFDTFQEKQQKEYKEFKNKADEEFATFLKEAWQKYNASMGDSMPTRPEPVKPTLFDKKKPVPAPVEIKPAVPKIPIADKPGVLHHPSGQQYVPGLVPRWLRHDTWHAVYAVLQVHRPLLPHLPYPENRPHTK